MDSGSSKFMADSGSPMTLAINIRLARPIAEVEIGSNAFLLIKAGNVDAATRTRMVEEIPHCLSYEWFRGPLKPYCSNNSCPRLVNGSADPSVWSRVACGSLSYICAVCERGGLEKYDSSFCSLTCFKDGWKTHARDKHSNLKFKLETNSSSNNNNNNNNNNNSSSSNRIVPTSFLETSASNDILWELVSADKLYAPSTLDVGRVLKLKVSAVSTHVWSGYDIGKILAEAVTYTEPVLASPKGPPFRPLISVVGALNNVTRLANFRVVSYNVLADCYANRQAYPHCDSWSLLWNYRRRMILQELLESQGDIFCLQEVQSDHYDKHILPFMESLGYDGIYKMKSREGAGGFAKVDGCATFWRRSRFALIENYLIDFNESARRTVGQMNLDESDSRKYLNRLIKDNIAQVIFLDVLRAGGSGNDSLGTRSFLCVVNTHLHSNPKNPDVKLWQTLTLVRELEQILQSRYSDVPILLCGDFNSEPDSAVYEFLAEGQIIRSYPEIEESDNLRILPDLRQVGHSLGLQSMMKCTLSREPAFTNFTSQFKGTLDYVWFSPSRLRVLAASSMPEDKELLSGSPGGLPNTTYPSDHVKLCCDIALIVNPNFQPSPVRMVRGGSNSSSSSSSSSSSNQGLPFRRNFYNPSLNGGGYGAVNMSMPLAGIGGIGLGSAKTSLVRSNSEGNNNNNNNSNNNSYSSNNYNSNNYNSSNNYNNSSGGGSSRLRNSTNR